MAMSTTMIKSCYTSAACNKCPHSVDWGTNSLICYAYCNSIAIFKPEGLIPGGGGKVLSTLSGHKGRVNTVSWIKDVNPEEEKELVSGSVDGTAKVWSTSDCHDQYKLSCSLEGHEAPITCVYAVYLQDTDLSSTKTHKDTLILTASVDSTVRIWHRNGTDVTETQVIDFKSGFALTVSVCILPGSKTPMLALGCDDHKIHLYAKDESLKFSELLSLQGHEDWIRDLQFTVDDDSNILLASCSQDHMIRVWKFSVREGQDAQKPTLSISELSIDDEIAVKETLFAVTTRDKVIQYAVSLESVLCGHDNWVYSVRWKPPQYSEDGKCHQAMKLLSASMDKTMILWSVDKESGVWVEEVRVGDVGGNSLGFYGGLFSPCGQSIIAYGYQGAFNQWTNKTSNRWDPQVTCGGHFGPVMDLAWSGGGGDYLLTVSTDQTTRLHAPWVRKDRQPAWFEVARPQIHGYDMQCIAMLGRYSFASGADEKLVRLFSAPKNFLNNFCGVCGHNIDEELASEESQRLPEGANVPALGLSNKAVFSDSEGKVKETVEEPHKMGMYPENTFTPLSLNAPPPEDQLLQNTLWPEVAKLYGHGYEIYALAAHPSGKLLASSCKAAKADSANILLWDTETKRQVGSLSGCALTVTQMAFSNNGDYLLAVSRDRTWTLYHKTETGQYVLKASVDKKTSAHSRIIWSCAWSHDDKYFFTASRDKKVMAWCVSSIVSEASSAPPSPVMSESLPDSVTAICSAPIFVQENRYLIAAGLDSGHISLHLWTDPGKCDNNSNKWITLKTLTQSEAHHLTVTRLAFRPRVGRTGYQDDSDSQLLQLASCGADHAVRVYDLDLTCL